MTYQQLLYGVIHIYFHHMGAQLLSVSNQWPTNGYDYVDSIPIYKAKESVFLASLDRCSNPYGRSTILHYSHGHLYTEVPLILLWGLVPLVKVSREEANVILNKLSLSAKCLSHGLHLVSFLLRLPANSFVSWNAICFCYQRQRDIYVLFMMILLAWSSAITINWMGSVSVLFVATVAISQFPYMNWKHCKWLYTYHGFVCILLMAGN